MVETADQLSVERHLQILRRLQAPSGLFLASAPGVSTGYDKAWLRDNFYTALAFEAAGEWGTVYSVWRAVLDILLKHEDKINWAATHKPHATWQYIHARYHPETFEEFWEEWGNKQNDAVGAILFKLGELETKGRGVVTTDADRRIVQRLIDYLQSIEYWQDADSGMWEEGEELHASSVGAVVAGLKQISSLVFVSVPAGLIEKGEEALQNLLPRESRNKFCDLALLSLIYPYRVVDRGPADEILKNVEYHLAKKRGIMRYKTDHYYNKNTDSWSEEAEWTMGLAWLAIIYAERGELDRARFYLEQAGATMTPTGELPELYYSNSDHPNENVPLGWAQSLYVVARLKVS